MENVIIYGGAMLVWTIIGGALVYKLIPNDSPTIIRMREVYTKLNEKADKITTPTEDYIMKSNTFNGIKKDLSNLKDKAVILLINLLDMLRGDYVGQEKER